MNKLAILTAFLAGYVVNDMVGEIISPAYAQGLDSYDVEELIEDCSIYGSIDGEGDGTGYGEVDGGEVYIYSLDVDVDIDHSLYISC